MDTREIQLEGKALCLVRIGYKEVIVITTIKVDGTYTPDWQCDGGFYHDEGWFDIDLSEAEIVYPDEYEIVNLDHTFTEGTREISELIKVIDSNLTCKDF